MKTCGALLVLLCCTLAQLRGETISENDITHQGHYGEAEIRENEVLGAAQGPEAADPDTASTQQTCQPDIHTVLREMTALVTELKVELRHTKTQVEDLEASLRASETKAEAMETRLSASETKSETMETRLRASENKAETMETRLRASETKAETMESRLRASETKAETMETRLRASETKAETMETRLRASETKGETMESRLRASEKTVEEQRAEFRQTETRLTARVNLTGSQVEELRREREERKVSFSAALLESGRENIGPFHAATPLVYRHVFTNLGNAYNPNTGVFTAPVRGIYHFVVFAYGLGHESTGCGVSLHKNREHITIAWSRQPSQTVTPSSGASLLLEIGDAVSVKLRPSSWLRDNGLFPNTFSGHLLFTL